MNKLLFLFNIEITNHLQTQNISFEYLLISTRYSLIPAHNSFTINKNPSINYYLLEYLLQQNLLTLFITSRKHKITL